MKFSSDEQRRAVCAKMNGVSLKRRKRIRSGPKIHYVNENRFDQVEKEETGHLILAKGMYNHRTDEIWINKDAIRSEGDRLHTLYHEMGHRNLHTYDESKAEQYAQHMMQNKGVSLCAEDLTKIPKEELPRHS